MNHLNQRFLGGVGWRQNEQTFDGLRLQQKIGSDMTLDVAAVHNVTSSIWTERATGTQRGDAIHSGLKLDCRRWAHFKCFHL